MRQDTNMLFVRVGEENAAALGEYMKARNVLINASPIVRPVTHLDVSREQLAEVAAHWRAFWRVKEGDVPQRILVLGASGYIGQHLVRTLSQQGHQIRRRHVMSTGLQSCNWQMSVAIKSISAGRITFRPCCRISIRSIFWCTAWAKAAILSLRSAGGSQRPRCAT